MSNDLKSIYVISISPVTMGVLIRSESDGYRMKTTVLFDKTVCNRKEELSRIIQADAKFQL